MERGPMALFGAIVAVGLGPAMWLGAQFGNAVDVPSRPPAVTSEHGPQQKTQTEGGAAGSAPDTSVLVETTPRAEIKPLPQPARRPASHKTSKPADPSTSPTKSSTSPSPSDDGPSTPPSDGDDSSPPNDPGGGGGNPPASPPGGQDQGSGGSGGTGDGQPIAG
jgi:hypothetical protein